MSRQRRKRGREKRRWWPLAAALIAAELASIGEAHSYSVEVDATLVGQGYEMRTADAASDDARRVDRRRLTSYLGLSISGLGRKDFDGLPALRDQFSMTVQLRVDTDFGDYLCNIGRSSQSGPLGCRDPGQGSVRTDPELQNNRPELLLAYVEGQKLGGWVDLRLGRQILWDLFDLRGIDGAWVSVATPFYFAIEAFGGLSQNGALPIDPPLYVLDGTSRSVQLSPDAPTQQFRALQPTVGVSVRTNGLRDFQGRLSYRRTFSMTQDLSPEGCRESGSGNCAPTSGTIEERLSYTVHGRLLDGRLQGWGGLRYDFVSGRFDDGQVALRATLRPQHTLTVDYRYSAPTWDGDSIFNVFASDPYHHAQVAYDGRAAAGEHKAAGEISWHARGYTRLFRSSEAVAGATDATALLGIAASFGGDIGLRYRRSQSFLRLDGFCDGGYGGLHSGADLSARLLLWRDSIGLEGRLLYMYWADDQRDSNFSHSFGAQAGVRWTIFNGALLHLLAEENVSRFYNSQLRLLAVLDLAFLLGPQTSGRPPAGLAAAGFGSFPAPGLMPGVLQ